VHYRECKSCTNLNVVDKRLDEWVQMDRFVISNEADSHQIPLGEAGTLTRNLRKKMMSSLAPSPSPSPLPSVSASTTGEAPIVDSEYEKLEREHEEATKVKNIQKIELGQWEIDCWYFSPYPDEYCHVDRLYICEKCLKYMKYPESLARHEPGCDYNGPPGRLIYLKDNVAVYELDGQGLAKLYCQNISLMAKLFLDHKTLYYDVGPFMFYVVCDVSKDSQSDREDKIHPVGYFSKEKESGDNYNLACIMILPPYQRLGYGRFLIELSYELSKREGKTGSPEKPLSDLGLVSYRSFWTQILLEQIKQFYTKKRDYPLISELSKLTSILRNDIIETLSLLNLTKLWRGEFVLNIESMKQIDDLLKKYLGRKQIRVDPEFLTWFSPKPNSLVKANK
jgi:histone acetyltransferase MYST1